MCPFSPKQPSFFELGGILTNTALPPLFTRFYHQEISGKLHRLKNKINISPSSISLFRKTRLIESRDTGLSNTLIFIEIGSQKVENKWRNVTQYVFLPDLTFSNLYAPLTLRSRLTCRPSHAARWVHHPDLALHLVRPSSNGPAGTPCCVWRRMLRMSAVLKVEVPNPGKLLFFQKF